jgi:hypothetical protein
MSLVVVRNPLRFAVTTSSEVLLGRANGGQAVIRTSRLSHAQGPGMPGVHHRPNDWCQPVSAYQCYFGEAERIIRSTLVDSEVGQAREGLGSDRPVAGLGGAADGEAEAAFGVAMQASIEAHARADTPVSSSVRIDGAVDTLVQNQDVAEHAVAVLREAVSNALRYSQAREIVVTIEAADHLIIDVVDNGIGIPDGTARSGLLNLERRATKCGGTLAVHRRGGPGGGLLTSATTPGSRRGGCRGGGRYRLLGSSEGWTTSFPAPVELY